MTVPEQAHDGTDVPAARRLGEAVLDVIVGVAMVIVGLAGLALPVLPGWIFIAGGVVVMAGRIPFLRSGLNRVLASRSVSRALSWISQRPTTRRSLERALKMPRIRRVVSAPMRWSIIHRAARAATQESAGGIHDGEA